MISLSSIPSTPSRTEADRRDPGGACSEAAGRQEDRDRADGQGKRADGGGRVRPGLRRPSPEAGDPAGDSEPPCDADTFAGEIGEGVTCSGGQKRRRPGVSGGRSGVGEPVTGAAGNVYQRGAVWAPVLLAAANANFLAIVRGCFFSGREKQENAIVLPGSIFVNAGFPLCRLPICQAKKPIKRPRRKRDSLRSRKRTLKPFFTAS